MIYIPVSYRCKNCLTLCCLISDILFYDKNVNSEYQYLKPMQHFKGEQFLLQLESKGPVLESERQGTKNMGGGRESKFDRETTWTSGGKGSSVLKNKSHERKERKRKTERKKEMKRNEKRNSPEFDCKKARFAIP